MDDGRSISLPQLMANEGLIPSQEEDIKRRNVIEKLKEIVVAWVKKVAWQRGLPKEQIAAANATVLTYGSYGLGVHSPVSDIDALCVGPFFATMNDFFVVLRNMLKSRLEVADVQCVKAAHVPLMQFKFEGILVDLPYAQLKVSTVPDSVDIFDPTCLRDIDETSWKSLSGVCANRAILQLVPNLKDFQSMLRCIKFWAKRRGVYGSPNGFLGGIHFAILAAFVCQNHPNANLSALVSNFFTTFATWSWPKPVVLQDGIASAANDAIDAQSLIPILLPCSPYDYCHSSITKSTFYKIRSEFLRGHSLTKDLLKPNFIWGTLFEPFMYSKNYTRFIKIFFSAPDLDELEDWVGWAKSHFLCLLLKLEGLQGFVDPNPTECVDLDVVEPNIVFYWGLNPGRNNVIDINSIKEEFLRNLTLGYRGICRKMELSIVQASELPREALFDGAKGKKMKAQWKNLDYHQQKTPVHSQHLPNYFVGHAAGDLTHQHDDNDPDNLAKLCISPR